MIQIFTFLLKARFISYVSDFDAAGPTNEANVRESMNGTSLARLALSSGFFDPGRFLWRGLGAVLRTFDGMFSLTGDEECNVE